MIHGLILAYLSRQYLGDIFSGSNEPWNAKFGPVLTKLSTIYSSSATKYKNVHLNCTLYIKLMENVSGQLHRCDIEACYSTSSTLFWPFKLKLHIFPSSFLPKCDDLALKIFNSPPIFMIIDDVYWWIQLLSNWGAWKVLSGRSGHHR